MSRVIVLALYGAMQLALLWWAGRRPGVERPLAVLALLAFAVLLDTERLFFLAMIVPVILFFLFIYGLMGSWVAMRPVATTAGIALGLILAWALEASFPLFSIGRSG